VISATTATIARASIGFLKRHPWQWGLAVIGIAAGVAAMVAVDLANQSARRAFTLSMDALNGRATHQIVSTSTGIPQSLYTVLRREHGIRLSAPIISGSVETGGRLLQLLGVDVLAERNFRQFTMPRASDEATRPTQLRIRRLLSAQPNVMVGSSTASALGWQIGDTVSLLANGKERKANVLGFLPDDVSQPDNLIISDIGIAQDWLELGRNISHIDLRLEDKAQELQIIRDLLPSGVSLQSVGQRDAATLALTDAFMTNLTAMSLMALLVGLFLIYNSVAFSVLQRRKTLALFRSLGLTRGDVLRVVVSEAIVLAAIGSTLGVIAGVWLGNELLLLVAQTVNDHFFSIEVTAIEVSLLTIAKGLLAGLIATLVAAAMPAAEASAYTPGAAMQRSSVERRAGKIARQLPVIGIALLVAAATILLISTTSLVAGLLALFLMILGGAMFIPATVAFLSRQLAPIAGRFGGPVVRLAVGGIGATLSRTGVAAIALAIAVAATISVQVMVDSFRLSVNQWLQTSLQSDVYVAVPGGSIDSDLLADIGNLSDVRDFTTRRSITVEDPGGRVRIIAVTLAKEKSHEGADSGLNIRGQNPAAAWQAFRYGEAVLVSDSFAYRRGLLAGESFDLPTPKGPRTLEVAGVYESFNVDEGAVMIRRALFERDFDDDRVDSSGLRLREATEVSKVADQIRELSSGRQALLVTDNERIRYESMRIFDRTFVITDVLYWIAVIIAVVGILSAMLALQLERSAEFGLLRAIGMTPLQTSSMVNLQTGVIGLFAGLAAIPLGLLMAVVLIKVINRRAFGWQIDMVVPAEPQFVALLLATGSALLAGVYPGWLAARTVPANALRGE